MPGCTTTMLGKVSETHLRSQPTKRQTKKSLQSIIYRPITRGIFWIIGRLLKTIDPFVGKNDRYATFEPPFVMMMVGVAYNICAPLQLRWLQTAYSRSSRASSNTTRTVHSRSYLGIWWWTRAINNIVGEEFYDKLRLRRRILSNKFYYTRQ